MAKTKTDNADAKADEGKTEEATTIVITNADELAQHIENIPTTTGPRNYSARSGFTNRGPLATMTPTNLVSMSGCIISALTAQAADGSEEAQKGLKILDEYSKKAGELGGYMTKLNRLAMAAADLSGDDVDLDAMSISDKANMVKGFLAGQKNAKVEDGFTAWIDEQIAATA